MLPGRAFIQIQKDMAGPVWGSTGTDAEPSIVDNFFKLSFDQLSVTADSRG